VRIGTIGRDDPYILPFNIGPEQNVKCVRSSTSEHKIAREVLVSWVLFDDLIGLDSFKDTLPIDGSPCQSHVDMKGPVDPALTDAIPDESDWIFRDASVGAHRLFRM
jgi:hypothetical protein